MISKHKNSDNPVRYRMCAWWRKQSQGVWNPDRTQVLSWLTPSFFVKKTIKRHHCLPKGKRQLGLGDDAKTHQGAKITELCHRSQIVSDTFGCRFGLVKVPLLLGPMLGSITERQMIRAHDMTHFHTFSISIIHGSDRSMSFISFCLWPLTSSHANAETWCTPGGTLKGQAKIHTCKGENSHKVFPLDVTMHPFQAFYAEHLQQEPDWIHKRFVELARQEGICESKSRRLLGAGKALPNMHSTSLALKILATDQRI